MRTPIARTSVFFALVALAACSAREKSPPVVVPVAPPIVTIHATDYAYQAPDSISGGMVTLRLINDGHALHHATIVKLDSAKTVADLNAALKRSGPLPAWATLLGGPNAPAPGDTSNATLYLAPGPYAIVCFVDMPGGVPHFTKGMIRGLVVRAAAEGATTSIAADNSIELKDYGFVLAQPLTSGHHVFAVRNAVKQPHEVEVMKLAPGKTANDVLVWIQKPVGPPPAEAVGGVAAEAPGVMDYLAMDITPGNYLFICFVPDAKDGKPHFAHGMIHVETVT